MVMETYLQEQAYLEAEKKFEFKLALKEDQLEMISTVIQDLRDLRSEQDGLGKKDDARLNKYMATYESLTKEIDDLKKLML